MEAKSLLLGHLAKEDSDLYPPMKKAAATENYPKYTVPNVETNFVDFTKVITIYGSFVAVGSYHHLLCRLSFLQIHARLSL